MKNKVCHFLFYLFPLLCFGENNFLINSADIVLAYILRVDTISFSTFTEVKLSTVREGNFPGIKPKQKLSKIYNKST